ncbi:uncharacterized protein LACBIDRAFT_309609 [Laccaria bicolor S238N-H82]|uniref:Predicted protein n=1 Tax=Laccaria bicolor (strain S238N-H82 / ATCC MYA-4686) TaxID=486041 RepID=B0DSN2_LACBS|nr:uncharacterized protein LACBIDRAFT_309609 [Laccaria bicolor S238N-H82]EDR02351.1 predicted protein [Laccaria bicolor S238N-H82]|eukprot:XP_001887028.1 predicted protein [Laccaria bicolor S238N-H82]
MAGLERSAKRVSQWTNNELLAFNIRVKDAGVEAFFNIPQLPLPTVSTTILDNLDEPPGPLLEMDYPFFAYKHYAEQPHTFNDFPMFLLKLLRYESGRRLLLVWAKDPLLMAGRRVIANTDLYLMKVGEVKEVLLIVHEDKHSNQDPEAQVIAKAIAAFDRNNNNRVKSGLQRLPDKDIWAIVNRRNALIFYRVHVTTALVDALAAATYPQEETMVLRFIPPVPNHELYKTEGMHPLANRRSVFQCLEALKAVIGYV